MIIQFVYTLKRGTKAIEVGRQIKEFKTEELVFGKECFLFPQISKTHEL